MSSSAVRRAKTCQWLAIAPALLALGVWNSPRSRVLAALLLPGLLLFAGGVLFRAFAGVSPGPVAPLGGVALIAGWLMLVVLAWRHRPE